MNIWTKSDDKQARGDFKVKEMYRRNRIRNRANLVAKQRDAFSYVKVKRKNWKLLMEAGAIKRAKEKNPINSSYDWTNSEWF